MIGAEFLTIFTKLYDLWKYEKQTNIDGFPEACYVNSAGIYFDKHRRRYLSELKSKIYFDIKNKVHAILSKNGITIESSDIFGKKAIRHLKGLNLRACYKQGIDGYIRLVENLNLLIEEVTERVKGIVEDNSEAQLLTTIPGIGYYSALLIVSEI